MQATSSQSSKQRPDTFQKTVIDGFVGKEGKIPMTALTEKRKGASSLWDTEWLPKGTIFRITNSGHISAQGNLRSRLKPQWELNTYSNTEFTESSPISWRQKDAHTRCPRRFHFSIFPSPVQDLDKLPAIKFNRGSPWRLALYCPRRNKKAEQVIKWDESSSSLTFALLLQQI